MNNYRIVLKPARLALTLLALSVIIAIAVVAGLARYRTEKQQAIVQTEQRLTATRDNIKALTYDLATINKLAQRYRQLSQLGLIGEPDRDGWVQRLEALYRDTHLPPTLRYTLAPPQLINPQPFAYQNAVSHHDLNLELSGIHEGEFLDFMDKLSKDWRTPYRVETCLMSREVDAASGLQIKCTLQVYSLPGK